MGEDAVMTAEAVFYSLVDEQASWGRLTGIRHEL
jgi:hypothetical protein